MDGKYFGNLKTRKGKVPTGINGIFIRNGPN